MSGGKLPKGWVDTQLGSIIELKYGKSLAAQIRDGFGFPVYGSNGVVGKHSIPLINKSGLIVGRKGSYGVVNKSIGPFFPIDTTYYIDDFYNQPLEFLFYYLSFLPLTKLNRSTAIPGLNRDDAYNLNIALPPLAEQKIIAGKLDTLLAQVDSTKARLEQIPQILKRFRQAVLSAAVGGKFTTDTGFIQSPLTIGHETSFSLKGWQWHKLTELAQLESGHTPRKTISEYWDNGDIPWISLQDIRAVHGKVIYKTKFMPTQKGIDNSSARLLPEGTVCFSRDISVGYTTIMGTSMATTQHFANWICGKKLNNKYLMFSFMAAKQHLTKSGQGTTVKTIYMPALKELQILIPPLPEQHEIVRRVEQLFAYADTIEKQVNSALTRVNSLTQSILAKAFRGELTAQWRAENPDLISGENSAAALLEKIKAERAASGGKKASRKKA
ncbi:TPA: restriction endonuclease subunit S [Serratia marcescens]|nr:restriction endonuclease subunit S [Serratia marcescens]